jgi:carbon catabolite-derepressing protein kinase
MPSHLSDGARRLIAKMLITNSEERATIPQIFADPWFKVDLPDYLIPTGTTQLTTPKGRETQSQLDESIVAKVAEVRYQF